MQSFSIARTIADRSAELLFVPTLDDLYVPVLLRRPAGVGGCPVIVMGRGNGRGGVEHLEREAARVAAMQDRMLDHGYAVAYANYRNEVPNLYARSEPARRVHDDLSGGENRVLKSSAALDSDDLRAILAHLRALPWTNGRIGAMGVSHSGELILKVAAEMAFDAGVVIEGASHEFLAVDTGPMAPRVADELQYQDIDVVRRHANEAVAMSRIRRIGAPILHLGRDSDHLQGIFRLAHTWMQAAGKDTQWVSHDHPEHGYPFIYADDDGRYAPDAIQQAAFDTIMDFFGRRLR